MSNIRRPVLLFVVCAGLFATAATADASSDAPKTPLPAPVIVVVDVQRILDESLAAKSVQKQLETHRSVFQTEIGKEENELRQAEEDLNKAHDQLTADAYSDREQQLRQRFLTVERRVQARRKVLDQAFSDSMNTVRASLLAVVNEVAHEHAANLVLIKQQVLWSDKSFDMTDEILNRLNAKLPQITVKMAPEEKAEETPQ